MKIAVLDIETRPLDGGEYSALEPWKTRQGKAEIASISVCYPDNTVKRIVNNIARHLWIEQVRDLLRSLNGMRVFTHYGTFDIAFIIGTIDHDKYKPIPKEIMDIHWADTMLLVKWLINGQVAEDSRFSYSLANLVETFLADHPQTAAFLEMKARDVRAGEDDEYWESRGDMDVIMTKALAEKMLALVPESMRVGLMTEWADLPAVANSWINGIPIDANKIEAVDLAIDEQMKTFSEMVGVPGTVFTSPKQLGNLLFNQWGLTPWSYTPTKQPSTAGDDLLWIAYELRKTDANLADKLDFINGYKSLSTLRSKYIKSLRDALSYTGDGHIYGVPKLFGTYTGRMTYSNRTKKDGPKVSIALHQLPRVKGKFAHIIRSIRSLLKAPEGMGVTEFDASGQESRLMAIRSGDPIMLEIFDRGLNFHSMTGAGIIGMEYNEFMKNYKEQEKTGGYYIEQRQLGKLTNLSCNYRIGGAALAKKAFTEYDTYMTDETGRHLVNTFSRQYAGVPEYWSEVVRSAKANGYTECFGGRRYKISKWDSKNSWISESSAINMPIQGAGASMKEIAISVLTRDIPEALFALDLHDATFNFVPLDRMEEMSKEILERLNSIDYEPFWGFKPAIPLPYESAKGLNFGEVK